VGSSSSSGGAAHISSGGVSSSSGSGVLDWRQAQTWALLEQLMDLEGGLVVADAALAAWLAPLLQPHSTTTP
jgi:hypothetical protein